MPTYEYRCKACGHELEIQQSFSDGPLTDCPSCGATALRKVFGNIAVSFKGSGFYKNDSRSGASSTSSSSSSDSKSDSSSSESKSDSSSSESKSESKSTSETKTETKTKSDSTAAAS